MVLVRGLTVEPTGSARQGCLVRRDAGSKCSQRTNGLEAQQVGRVGLHASIRFVLTVEARARIPRSLVPVATWTPTAASAHADSSLARAISSSASRALRARDATPPRAMRAADARAVRLPTTRMGGPATSGSRAGRARRQVGQDEGDHRGHLATFGRCRGVSYQLRALAPPAEHSRTDRAFAHKLGRSRCSVEPACQAAGFVGDAGREVLARAGQGRLAAFDHHLRRQWARVVARGHRCAVRAHVVDQHQVAP